MVSRTLLRRRCSPNVARFTIFDLSVTPYMLMITLDIYPRLRPRGLLRRYPHIWWRGGRILWSIPNERNGLLDTSSSLLDGHFIRRASSCIRKSSRTVYHTRHDHLGHLAWQSTRSPVRDLRAQGLLHYPSRGENLCKGEYWRSCLPQYLASTIVDPSILLSRSAEEIAQFTIAMKKLHLKPKLHHFSTTQAQPPSTGQKKSKTLDNHHREGAEGSKNTPAKAKCGHKTSRYPLRVLSLICTTTSTVHSTAAREWPKLMILSSGTFDY